MSGRGLDLEVIYASVVVLKVNVGHVRVLDPEARPPGQLRDTPEALSGLKRVA